MQDVSERRRATFLGFQPPAVGDEEVEAVAETIRSGWLTTGPKAAELEARFAELCGAPHVLAVSSGTAALHLALLALGVGPGDEVVTTPITWPATVNVIVHCGARPVLADVRDGDLNLDPEDAARRITPRTKAIMPVDLAGQPADLDAFAALGLPVVEDAAHAAEARYRGRPVGSVADVTCFSLYATKNIAAGEGGLVATTRDDVAQRIDDLRVMRRGHGSLYDIPVPGYKANLSDVLASIALVQLDKLERHREARRRQFELYDAAVAELDGIEPLARDPRDTHAMHLYVVRDRRRARGRHARRVPAAPGRREHRHEHPLPARPPADRLPGRFPQKASPSPSGPATRCSRCRSPRPTRRTTSATRSPRCAASTPRSPDEPLRSASS